MRSNDEQSYHNFTENSENPYIEPQLINACLFDHRSGKNKNWDLEHSEKVTEYYWMGQNACDKSHENFRRVQIYCVMIGNCKQFTAQRILLLFFFNWCDYYVILKRQMLISVDNVRWLYRERKRKNDNNNNKRLTNAWTIVACAITNQFQ